jgi:subtilase family serine protease
LIKRIDKHNTYLSKANDKEIEGAIKNYMVSALLAISSDSANMIEAHTGVDVATGPFKAIANKSALSEVQKTFTPGNVFNKFQAIEEASVGKDDIAICATGLKSFFAST